MSAIDKFERIVLAVCWAALAWAITVYSLHPIHDGDTWWHLAQGREMLEHRVFLRTDIFSHTLLGAQWINFEWLSEIGAYAVVKIFGLKGLLLTKATLGMLSLALLIRLLYVCGARGAILFALTWLAYHVLQVRLCTRIELVSFIFFPALLLIIQHIRTHGSSKFHASWIGFALFMIWANTHGGFAYGLLLLALILVGARWAGDTAKRVATLDRLFVAGLLGSMINPWGPKLFSVFVQHAQDFSGGSVIAEWESPTFASAPEFWASCALGIGAAIWMLWKSKRENRAWIPAVIVFSLLGSRYLRTTSYLAFVALPVTAIALREFPMTALVRLFAAFVVASLLWLEKPFLHVPTHWTLVDQTTVPAGGVTFLRAQNIEGTMFNTYSYGGFVEWTEGMTRPVFMDGRYIFYPTLARYEDVMLGKKQEITAENWNTYFENAQVDYALVKYEPLRLHRTWDKPVKHESAMNVMFPKTMWALVYWDDACLVFLKRVPKFQNVIAAEEYTAVMPYDLPAVFNSKAEGAATIAKIEQELKRNEQTVGPTQRGFQIKAALETKS